MWANRNPATEDLNRIVSHRRQQTAIRNQIAATKGSPYQPHVQDRLTAEVQGASGLMDKLTERNMGEWKKGGMFGMFGSVEDDLFFKERENTYGGKDGINEGQTGHLEKLQDLITVRKAMMAEYVTIFNKISREKAVIEDKDTSAHRQLRAFLQYGGSNVDGFSAEYTELVAKYNRDEGVLKAAQEKLYALEVLLIEQEGAIKEQDDRIREQAELAGVDVEGADIPLLSNSVTYVKDSAGPFFAGGLVAVTIALLLARRKAPSYSKPRTGSAYSVFMSNK